MLKYEKKLQAPPQQKKKDKETERKGKRKKGKEGEVWGGEEETETFL
jgi:hypothetical protein